MEPQCHRTVATSSTRGITLWPASRQLARAPFSVKGETLREYRWCNEHVLTIREGRGTLARRKASAVSRARFRTTSAVTTHLDVDLGRRHGTARELFVQSRAKTTLTIAPEVSSTPKEQIQLRARGRCGTVSICLATRSKRREGNRLIEVAGGGT